MFVILIRSNNYYSKPIRNNKSSVWKVTWNLVPRSVWLKACPRSHCRKVFNHPTYKFRMLAICWIFSHVLHWQSMHAYDAIDDDRSVIDLKTPIQENVTRSWEIAIPTNHSIKSCVIVCAFERNKTIFYCVNPIKYKLHLSMNTQLNSIRINSIKQTHTHHKW